jgi:hypothetical protein
LSRDSARDGATSSSFDESAANLVSDVCSPIARDGYFLNNIPTVRAIRLTDPAWRPSSSAIFDAPIPCRASLSNRRTSCSVHCFGFGVFMALRSTGTS